MKQVRLSVPKIDSSGLAMEKLPMLMILHPKILL